MGNGTYASQTSELKLTYHSATGPHVSQKQLLRTLLGTTEWIRAPAHLDRGV